MTLTPPPDLERIIRDLEGRLDQLERRKGGTFLATSDASSAAAPELIFAKQMYGPLNDPGGGAPTDPWGGYYGGIFDPGSTDPQHSDCAYMSMSFPRDEGIGHRTGVFVDWVTDAGDGSGSDGGDWGWVEQGCWHQADPADTNGYGLSSAFWELFSFDPARGAGAYGDVALTCYASDFALRGGGSTELLLDADLYAQGFAETDGRCLAGRDFTGGGSGVSDDNTGVSLVFRYIRDDVGAAHQDFVMAVASHAHTPELAYGGSFIMPHDDAGVDWWHGGIRGPVLTDRSTADRYRVTVASGVVGSELA